jgi:glutathione S-transferase
MISQPSRAVKALLDIGRINCKLILINLFKLEQKQPEFLNINPMGTVPALVHKNLKITESIAILVYLC